MKRLRFEYSTELVFPGNVSEHCFTLRCLPFSDGRQIIREPRYDISPRCAVWHSRDSFGNSLLCGRITEPHERFYFGVSGEAQIINDSSVPGTASAIFGCQSPMTVPGESILEFYNKYKPTEKYVLDRAIELSDRLYSVMTYQKGVTSVDTTAEEAMALGAGVCQDYAHIFLSLCRLDGIRCRYVSGLAYDCGETHAWAEISEGGRWRGIDPTNNRLIGDNYIKLCHGRDYSDCPIERGIYLGAGGGVQTVQSSVTAV